jgi:sRNA-binding carbon storage regulator CsrA
MTGLPVVGRWIARAGGHFQGGHTMGGLCLTRRKDEGIILKIPGHSDLAITVIRAIEGQCKLYFQGDREIGIVRSELLKRDPDDRTNARTVA